MKKILTIEELDREIARLSSSEEVKIARKEQQIWCLKQQHLVSLQNLAKRGGELVGSGITLEDMREMEESLACEMDFLGDELSDCE